MKNVYSLKHTANKMKIKTIVIERKYLKIIDLSLDTRIYEELSKLSITKAYKQTNKQKKARIWALHQRRYTIDKKPVKQCTTLLLNAHKTTKKSQDISIRLAKSKKTTVSNVNKGTGTLI